MPGRPRRRRPLRRRRAGALVRGLRDPPPRRPGPADRGRRPHPRVGCVRPHQACRRVTRGPGSRTVPQPDHEAARSARRPGPLAGGGLRDPPQPDAGVDAVASSDAAALQPPPQGTHRSMGRTGSAPPPRDDHAPRERAARSMDRRPRGRVHRPVRSPAAAAGDGEHPRVPPVRHPTARRSGATPW